jgi:hypothetical protein
MPEAHVKFDHMLENRKAPDATKATILRDETIGNQQVTLIEIAWLSGIIDGEGYVGIQMNKSRGNKYWATAAIQIGNTDEEIILKSADIMKRMGTRPYIRTYIYGLKNRPKHKIQYSVSIRRMTQVPRVLSIVNPYLTGTKKIRGELVLEFCKSRMKHFIWGSHKPQPYSERELQIINIVRPMQSRGTSETRRRTELQQSKIWNEQKTRGFVDFPITDDIVHPFAKA